MNDRQLRYAHTVWRERSFSKAGEKLGVSQPSLSEQIRLLEKELGFELFIRSSRGVDASPNGQSFLQEVDAFVGQFADLKLLAQELHGRPGTRVHIGLGHGLVASLVPVIGQTLCSGNRRVHPEISTGTTRRIHRLLHQQRLDIGFVYQTSTATIRPSLVQETLADDEIVAVLSPEDPLAALANLSLAAFSKRRAIMSEPRLGYGSMLLAHFAKHGDVPEVAAYCDDTDALKYFVLAGQDVAFLPRMAVASEVASGAVRALPLDPPLRVGIQLVRRAEKFPDRLEKALETLKASAMVALQDTGPAKKL
jgi:DNA-binding transcriptional LysR family regulator